MKNNIKLISASAGSGKTYRLMNEIADRVAGTDTGIAQVAPEEIMATTFTNKAAAELRERIRMRLLAEGRAGDAQRINDGLIGTVNSVCARLLKEYAFEAGLSPAVDIMPAEDAERIFNMATATSIAKSAVELEPIARRMELLGYENKYRKVKGWRDFVQDIVDAARSNNMDADALRSSGEHSWQSMRAFFPESHSDKIAQGLDQRLKIAVDVAIQTVSSGKDKTKVTQTALKLLQSVSSQLATGIDQVSWSDWLGLSSLKIGAKSKEAVAPIQEQAKQHMNHPRFQSDMQHMIKGVFECAATALESYATYKQEQGKMDFVDQESLVLTMARDNESFRASIQERVKVMMVDEFQDTSPIQLALFLQLAELAEDVVWVGDPKQAIYGFRGADPELMAAVTAEVEAYAATATGDNILKYSWRSRRELVNFSNAVFTPVFHQMGAKKVQLEVPEVREQQAAGGWLESWILEGGNQEKRSTALVENIQSMISERGFMQVMLPYFVAAIKIAITCRKLWLQAAFAHQLRRAIYWLLKSVRWYWLHYVIWPISVIRFHWLRSLVTPIWIQAIQGGLRHC